MKSLLFLNLLDMNQESDKRSCLYATFGVTILLGDLVENTLFAAVAVR
jgi:hypothetical protein